jgi:hypothetical protein
MIQFLISLIPVCLGIWAVHIIFQEDMIFEKQGNFIENKLGKYWSKPVVSCPVCMSSIWGIIGFFSIRYFFNVDLPIRQILPFVFCLCGLNTIISKLTSKERVIVEDE